MHACSIHQVPPTPLADDLPPNIDRELVHRTTHTIHRTHDQYSFFLLPQQSLIQEQQRPLARSMVSIKGVTTKTTMKPPKTKMEMRQTGTGRLAASVKMILAMWVHVCLSCTPVHFLALWCSLLRMHHTHIIYGCRDEIHNFCPVPSSENQRCSRRKMPHNALPSNLHVYTRSHTCLYMNKLYMYVCMNISLYIYNVCVRIYTRVSEYTDDRSGLGPLILVLSTGNRRCW